MSQNQNQKNDQLKQEIARRIVEWRNGNGKLLEDVIDEIIKEVSSSCNSCSGSCSTVDTSDLDLLTLGPAHAVYNKQLYHNGNFYKEINHNNFGSLVNDLSCRYLLSDEALSETNPSKYTEVFFSGMDLTHDTISLTLAHTINNCPGLVDTKTLAVGDFIHGHYKLYEKV